MNCERCQELVSDFIDGALSDEDYKTFNAHLEECLACYNVRQELDSIVTFSRDLRGEYDAPPNERALWLRIRNTIESQPAVRAFAATSSSGRGQELNWVSRLLRRQWELSLPQVAAAIVTIAIVVSFATAFGIRSFQSSQVGNAGTNESGQAGSMRIAGGNSRSVDERIERQQQLVDHWSKRIEQRRALWSANTRGAFERNLQVIDQAVYVYREELRRNPHDEVSAEMLDSAMGDKMDLLREFSEL